MTDNILMYAIIKRDIDLVKMFANSEHLINKFDDKNIYTPLMYAIARAKISKNDNNIIQIIQILVNSKYIDLDLKNRFERTALIRALIIFHIDIGLKIARILIDAGSDVNLVDRHGKTRLMCTTKAKYVELLIKANANLDLQSSDGRSALMSQCGMDFNNDEKYECVELLINAGC